MCQGRRKEDAAPVPFPAQGQPFSGKAEAADFQPNQTNQKILVEHGSPLVKQLTVRERPGKTCFRFWQEGTGFDRNLFSAAALSASMDDIHMNPVKRGLCEKAIDWKWSSARFHADGTIDPDFPQLTRVDPLWFDESGTQISHS